MTINIRRILPASLVAVAAVVAAGCGSSSSSPAGNVTDRAFVNDMTPHHQSAVSMAQIALTRAQHPEIKQLATNIVADQKKEIGQMATFKMQIGAGDAKSSLGQSMQAMGMNMNNAALKTAKPFDRAFIDMMTPHHTGAIAMAKIELAKGKDPAVKALATRIIAAQTKEKAEMKTWRARWYGAGTTQGTAG